MWRSVLAIVTGFVFIAALAIGTDAAVMSVFPASFDATGRTDSVPMLLFIVCYVGIIATLGCWLTARMAPSHPMRHALVLGALGLVFNVVGTIQRWGSAPVWFHVVSLLLVMVWAWLGGWLRERQLRLPGAGAPAMAR